MPGMKWCRLDITRSHIMLMSSVMCISREMGHGGRRFVYIPLASGLLPWRVLVPKWGVWEFAQLVPAGWRAPRRWSLRWWTKSRSCQSVRPLYLLLSQERRSGVKVTCPGAFRSWDILH